MNNFDASTLKALAGKRKINKIIIHCSATQANRDIHAEDIRVWHTTERNFSDIGYHYVITLDGKIEHGRRLDKPGAHCRGHNRNSIGVCYIGGLDSDMQPADTRTAQQHQALALLVKTLVEAFPGATIHGHRDFAAKDCPCFDATAEFSNLSKK